MLFALGLFLLGVAMSVILIIADREGESQVALTRGLQLAAKMGFVVQVVGFCYEALGAIGITDKSELARIRKKLLLRRKTDLASSIEKLNTTKVHTSLTVVWRKDIHQWIDQQCARTAYAAVIKTGHRSGSIIYTSSDWHLLRECPAPILIASERKWHSHKPILAAIDLDSKLRVKQRLNDVVIATAKHYAEALGCPLFLLHVVNIPPLLRELDLVDEHSYTEKLKARLQLKLHKLATEHAIPLKQIRIKQGPVEKVVASEAARLKAQLVVMGTVGRRGIKAKLMGNTAERVLRTSHTDILAIKP